MPCVQKRPLAFVVSYVPLQTAFSSSQGRSRTRAGGAGVQEGGRTSWRCSPARTGQYQDHSQAGTGAQMLGWQARFPGQSFVGFLSLDGVHECLVEVCKAQARDLGSVW